MQLHESDRGMKKPGVHWPLGLPCTTWPVLEFGPLWPQLNHRDRRRCLHCKRCLRRCLRCPGLGQHHLGYLMGICREKHSGGEAGEEPEEQLDRGGEPQLLSWGLELTEVGCQHLESQKGNPPPSPPLQARISCLRLTSESPRQGRQPMQERPF